MSKEQTIADIYNLFTNEQKRAVHFIVGAAMGPKITLRCDLLPTRRSHVDNMNMIHSVIKSACEAPNPVYLKDFLKKLGFKLGGVKKWDGWRINKKFFDNELLLTGIVNESGDMDYCIHFLSTSNCKWVFKEFYANNEVVAILTLKDYRERVMQHAIKRAEREYIKRDIEATKEAWAKIHKE